MHKAFTVLSRQIQHEATWFSACDHLLSGGGILQHQPERIYAICISSIKKDIISHWDRITVAALSTRWSPDRCLPDQVS